MRRKSGSSPSTARACTSGNPSGRRQTSSRVTMMPRASARREYRIDTMNGMDASSRSGIDQAEIRFLVEKNADGILVIDEQGIVLFANPAAERIFGRTIDLLIG